MFLCHYITGDEKLKKEIVERFVLKHIDTGGYISVSPDHQPLTMNLRQARRFLDTEQISVFLELSPYRPDKPEDFEIVMIEIEYREVLSNE